ncbi:MAG: DUF4372 domain-containing protein [Acidobacteriaceae bacterium]
MGNSSGRWKNRRRSGTPRGFTCWGQFVSMLFCQVAQLKSLREVCMGLAGQSARVWPIPAPSLGRMVRGSGEAPAEGGSARGQIRR